MGKSAKVKEEKETVEEETTLPEVIDSDGNTAEDLTGDSITPEKVDEEFIEVVGDSDEVINEIEEEVK